MSAHTTPSSAFNATANALEGVRQVAVSTASSQAAVIGAEITYYRGCFKAALANNLSASVFSQALKSLGVQT
jgi:hypothetical protein